MEYKLPDKVIPIELVRINRNIRKICSCENPQYDVDPNNRMVWCRDCGASIDPFDAIYNLAKRGHEMEEENQRLLEQRRQILNYQPHLVVFKSLERQYRSKEMAPVCPNCGKGFLFEKITGWINRKYME